LLLFDNFVKQVCNYSELKKYNVEKEKVTNVYYRIYLKTDNIIIQLDIEEMESYVSFLITHKTEGTNKYYYALADYSEIIGNKFSAFVTKIEDDIFIQNVKKAIKNVKRYFRRIRTGTILFVVYILILTILLKNIINLISYDHYTYSV
jgi:hypothetical protein